MTRRPAPVVGRRCGPAAGRCRPEKHDPRPRRTIRGLRECRSLVVSHPTPVATVPDVPQTGGPDRAPGGPRVGLSSVTDDQLTASYILTLSCPDRPGIVHAVAGALLVGTGGNITESQQYGSQSTGTFFMRVEVDDGVLPAGAPGRPGAGGPGLRHAVELDVGRAQGPHPGDGQHVGALPQRPAVPAALRHPADRDPGDRVQPPRPGGRSPSSTASPSTTSRSPRTPRPRPRTSCSRWWREHDVELDGPRPLHADPLRRPVPAS